MVPLTPVISGITFVFEINTHFIIIIIIIIIAIIIIILSFMRGIYLYSWDKLCH